MTARDDILAAIRQGLTHGSEGALPRRTPSEIAAEAAALLANPAEIRPAQRGADHRIIGHHRYRGLFRARRPWSRLCSCSAD